MKSEYQKTRDRNINKIKKGIRELQGLGYTIEAELAETMLGTEIKHVYIRDRVNDCVVEQKYLFTLNR